jgi:acetyltransferase-like isoleucine patch superfamily enzyme|tara:strand:+ start:1260 stop:1970 length:711 start_codon:yes stop_codon:yes gene_type:complete
VKYFQVVQNVLSVIVMVLFGVLFGLAMLPSYFLFLEIGEITSGKSELVEAVGICISLGLGYILWGVVLLLICGVIGGIFKMRKDEGRYPLRSFITIQWAFSLVSHRVAQIFLGLVIPSFLATTYYRMMGAKIGSGVQLLSIRINDASMITIGDGVVVGGDATINGHLVESGEIVLAPVRIGDGAVIGGGSVVQPGCKIGKGAVVASRAVLPKWTEVPDGEVWGGIPARFIKRVGED